MTADIVNLLTFVIVCMSFWCFSIMLKTTRAIKVTYQNEHGYNTEDIVSLVVSFMLFCLSLFVLWVEPGLIKKLPSVFSATISGAVILLFYMTDLLKCKHKHIHHVK